MNGADLHLDHSLLVTVSPERMLVFLPIHIDALPLQLLHGHEGLVDVCVFGHQVGSKMQREAFRMHNVRRGLCEICGIGGQSRKI